jgi:hypothetical protein
MITKHLEITVHMQGNDEKKQICWNECGSSHVIVEIQVNN